MISVARIGLFVAALALLIGGIAIGLHFAAPDERDDQTSTPIASAADLSLMATKIAVVDVQRIMQEAEAARDIREEVDTQRREYQAEIAEQEDELRSVEQELLEERGQLGQEEFAAKRSEFEQRVAEMQTRVQGRKDVLDRATNRAMSQVRDQMLQIIARIAEDQEASIVLSKQQVVLVERSLDITDAVLAELDRAMPTVSVDLSAVD